MSRIYTFSLLIFLLLFICSPAGIFTVIQNDTCNGKQIEQYTFYIIFYLKLNCREMCLLMVRIQLMLYIYLSLGGTSLQTAWPIRLILYMCVLTVAVG